MYAVATPNALNKAQIPASHCAVRFDGPMRFLPHHGIAKSDDVCNHLVKHARTENYTVNNKQLFAQCELGVGQRKD